jgi:hypothetical protein
LRRVRPDSPRALLGLYAATEVWIGIGGLGFLTPLLMDRISGGDPRRAGVAYAVNTVGCIAGPLVAGFVTLPALGERGSLVVLAAPLFVPALLPYFHEDFDGLLASPAAHVVVDDARRFLERSDQSFDMIVIDSPPPLAAAASSLLYSAEFYEIAARRLAPGGILQQWLPGGEPIGVAAVAKALASRFPHVRVYASMEGRGGGLHFLASEQPIPERTAAEAAGRMPPAAQADLIEWGPQTSAEAQLESMLKRKRSFQRLIDRAPDAPVLTDDRPLNEYYLMRQGWQAGRKSEE